MPSLRNLARLREQLDRLREARADIRAARLQTSDILIVAGETKDVARSVENELRALRETIAQTTAGAADAAKALTHAVRAAASDQARAAHADTAALSRMLDESRAELSALRRELETATAMAAADRERTILALRMVRDDDDRARRSLLALRETPEYERAFDDAEPLVSIIITTYLNWPLLRDRCLPSILAQTHERWEAIVVGDAAPDEARQVVEAFGDPRIHFTNLPYRGPYPEDPRDAWHMSGTAPWNLGLTLAKGAWIGANSDDDALRPTHIESLLRQAREQHAEVPYGALEGHAPDGGPTRLGVFPPIAGQWGMQASLMHGGLRFLPLQPSDWVFGVPNDVALLERMLRIGVHFSFLDEPVVDYYPSRVWSDPEQRLTRRESF